MNNEVFLEENLNVEKVISHQLWKHLETFHIFFFDKLGYYLYKTNSLDWSFLIRDFILTIFGAKYGWSIFWVLVHWTAGVVRFFKDVSIRDEYLQQQRRFQEDFILQQNRQAMVEFERQRALNAPNCSVESNELVPIVASLPSFPNMRTCLNLRQNPNKKKL